MLSLRLVVCAAPLVGAAVIAGPAGWSSGAQAPAAGAIEWRYYGGDAASTKYSPLGQITRANVNQLRIAWRWSSPDNEIAKAQSSGPARAAIRTRRSW